uniref:Uncharacterized protein n=1 Tax=Stapleton virus TaxID=2600331 RepID=A0A5B8X9Y6_9VIRU|nr:hypothetical protein 1 [Stapleton virus]
MENVNCAVSACVARTPSRTKERLFKVLEVATSRPVLLTAAGVAGLCMIGRHTGIHSKIIGGLTKTMPVLRYLMTKAGIDPPVVVETPKATMTTTFESVRPGSEEQNLPFPKNQLLVGELVMGEFHAYGAAVRISDWLVLPAHVYSTTSTPMVRGKQGIFDLTGYDFEEIDTDLLAIKLDQKGWATIGTPVGTICHEIGQYGSFVSIVGISGKGTTGVLQDDPHVFGRIIYHGTTKPGYSGAAYSSGREIVGIHTNGGAVNGGYSASYILSMLNYLDKKINEDSPGYLQNAFRKGKKIRVDKRWGGLDEIRAQVNGRFAIFQRSSMRDAFGEDWEDMFDDVGRGSYKDGARKIGESKVPLSLPAIAEPAKVAAGEECTILNSGVLGSLTPSPDQQQSEKQALMRLLEPLSAEQLKDLYRRHLEFLRSSNSQVKSKSIVVEKN